MLSSRLFSSQALVAGVCATCSVAMLDYTLVTGAAAERSLAVQRILLNQRRQQVQLWWNRQSRLIEAHVSDPVFRREATAVLRSRRLARRGSKPAGEAVLARLFQRNLAAREFALLTSGGITASSTNPDRIGWYQPLQNTTTAIDPQHPELTRLNFFTNPETGMPTVSVAYPLGVGPGGPGGYYIVDLDLAALSQLVSQAEIKDQKTRVDSERSRAYAVARTALNRTTGIHPQTPGLRELPNLESRGISQALDGSSGGGLYLDGSGVPVVGAYAPAGQLNLAILVEQSQRQLFRQARERLVRILVLGLLLCTLPVLLQALSARRDGDHGTT